MASPLLSSCLCSYVVSLLLQLKGIIRDANL
jgi:hypothetical protein